jgi:hypothetical protein
VAIIGASALLVFGLAAYATAAVPRFAGSMFLVAVVALLVAALSLLVWILGRLGRLGARVLGMAARSTELTIDQPAARKVPTGPVWAVTVAGRDHVVELHDADSRTGNWVRGGGSPGSVVCDGKLLPLRWQGSYLESSAGFTVGGQPARLICRHSPLDALGHGPSSGWHELLVEGAPVVQTG